jgi:predicted PurR-regulated permease PerM
MTVEKRTLFWVAGFIICALLIHLLSSILLPFVAGMLTAYFLDPIADKLEARRVPRGLATAFILLAFFFVVGGLLMLLFPMLQGQIIELAELVPGMIEAARQYIEPLLKEFMAGLPPDAMAEIKTTISDFAGNAAKWITKLLASVWSGGIALFNILSLLIITPVVAFYLLRDWDLITAKVDSWLPRGAHSTIRTQLSDIDATLAAFVRGQATVCLVLGLIYGIGLSMIGLKSGLLVGLGAGFISFIPYLGAASGLVVGVGIALFQFPEWMPIFIVAGIFLFGQTLESYVLTPRLVGDRVGLHPVWIIFALMAGGALFGFTGILLAVPMAAVIGVLLRFAITRYLESSLYNGGSGGSGGLQ